MFDFSVFKKIKTSSSSDSHTNTREIFNDNFKLFYGLFGFISDFFDKYKFIKSLNIVEGKNYVLRLKGNDLIAVEVNFPEEYYGDIIYAGNYHTLEDGKKIIVSNNKQYLLKNNLVLEGDAEITLEGNAELVII